ncbi:uncharacterized protein LOC117168305 [Belonocnema kinseyi]|uniref:uncharacterized protein LOC117168305 n=1 Tax=Belonocnema kinseyi TaxID=2817044 RepID=UPI00143D7C23|nr:uncharacterized protein LOC117168305 [Belonocnema kinseyi]
MFSKAKIRRFNDVQSDTPAPGAYNPVIQQKIRGYATQKAKRFPDEKIVSKPGPSNVKPKQMLRQDPRPTIKSTVNKRQKIQHATVTRMPGRVANHIYRVESEIENLKSKILSAMPSMKNKVDDLQEVWQDKKQSLVIDDKESGQLVDDNLNNILKEMSHLLNDSQKGRFQEIAFIQAMNA